MIELLHKISAWGWAPVSEKSFNIFRTIDVAVIILVPIVLIGFMYFQERKSRD